jgi:hypothetical protein
MTRIEVAPLVPPMVVVMGIAVVPATPPAVTIEALDTGSSAAPVAIGEEPIAPLAANVAIGQVPRAVPIVPRAIAP